MKILILHAGMPKTGSTSIQSTLFWSGHVDNFRYLSLDTDFGNRLLLGAFCSNLQERDGYFSVMTRATKGTGIVEHCRRYLTRCLEQCQREGTTPILSGEAAWSLSEGDYRTIRLFCEERGFRVRIVCYLRAPIDFFECSFSQSVKVGSPHLPDIINCNYSAFVKRLDDVFDEAQVSIYVFDPQSFPDRCVVTHFCESIGLPVKGLKVLRRNETLNLNVVKLLHASNSLAPAGFWTIRFRLWRRGQLEALKTLAGPPLRFQRQFFQEFLVAAMQNSDWLEKRIGCALPVSLVHRKNDVGISRNEELFEFSAESLNWLASRTYGCRLQGTNKTEVAGRVARRMKWVGGIGTLWLLFQLIVEQWRIRRQRNRMMAWLKKAPEVATRAAG